MLPSGQILKSYANQNFFDSANGVTIVSICSVWIAYLHAYLANLSFLTVFEKNVTNVFHREASCKIASGRTKSQIYKRHFSYLQNFHHDLSTTMAVRLLEYVSELNLNS